MTSSPLTPAPCQWFGRLAAALDRRSAPRLALLFLGAVLARGRRTLTSWIWAAGLSEQFRRVAGVESSRPRGRGPAHRGLDDETPATQTSAKLDFQRDSVIKPSSL